MPKIKKIKSFVLKSLHIIVGISGVLCLIFFLLATTSLPFWARYYLGSKKACEKCVPVNCIVLMGAGGYPSNDVLMRLWYTNRIASEHPQAKILIATPGYITDSTSTVFKTYEHLTQMGIDSSRIVIEPKGLNTRHQALKVYQMYKQNMFNEPLAIVSSPTHSYRAVKCFEKVGFETVCAYPTMEIMLETDLRFRKKELGGRKMIPITTHSVFMRYKFWDYLQYEIEVLREYIAIVYYKINGWI
jgi:uncharacterized SAM-binding protein YcdF (DUF218 family)